MKIVRKKAVLVPTKETKTVENKVAKKKLPEDVYKDEIEPVIIEVDETRHIVMSVKRGGELGLLALDIRWFQTTDFYTGFTKRGINIPIEYLGDLVSSLTDMLEDCEGKDLLSDDIED